MLDDTIDLTPASASASAAGTPRQPGAPLPEVRIVPAKTRIKLSDVAGSAPIIRNLALRDLKARYKQSLLGPIWIVFQPAALLAAFVIGFRGVSKVGTGSIPYAVFALAGVTMWSYFQAAVMAGTSSILSNGALVRKTACPRFAFPIASLLACLPSFVIPFCVTFVAALIDGRGAVRMLLIPVGAAWLVFLTTGIVAMSSAITVRFRDLMQALPFLLQVGAFVVPVGYPVSTLSAPLRVAVSLNPLTGAIEAWRWILLGIHPYLPSIFISLGAGLVLIVLGWRVFGRMEVKMADVI